MNKSSARLSLLIGVGLLTFSLLLYLPLILKGGIIVDDWGNLASVLTCSGFFDCYRQNFPIFANRPLAPLPITALTQLFGQHYFAYLLVNTSLFLSAVFITAYVIQRITGNLAAIVFFCFACVPFIAMPLVVSPINQSTASLSFLYWAVSLLSTYYFCITHQQRFFYISFCFLLASFLTYEITLPLVVFSVLLPLLVETNSNLNQPRIFLKKYLAPVLLVLIICWLWQKWIGPLWIDIPSRLHFSPEQILPQFSAWAKLFFAYIPDLFKKSLPYSTSSIYWLVALFILLIGVSLKWGIQKSMIRMRLFFLIATGLTFLASSLIYILSGAAVEVGGYGARGLSSTWFSLSLLLAGFSTLFVGFKRNVALALILILLLFSIKSFVVSRNNYIQSWKLQQVILSDFMAAAKETSLGSDALVIANVPEFTKNNFNNETVFSTSWDFPAALRILTKEQVTMGIVIDTRAGNFHMLNYKNGQLQADGFWNANLMSPQKNIWFYDYDIATRKGSLKHLQSESDLLDQLLFWGYLEGPGNTSYIRLGQAILFSKPWDHRQDFIKNGWYGEIESWGGIWSIDKRAALKLPLPTQKPKFLELVVSAFVSPSHPKQRVEIYFDGKPQKIVTLSEAGENHLVIPIPEDLLNTAYLEIQFSLPDAKSPKELGMGDDDRHLAIGMKSATFR